METKATSFWQDFKDRFLKAREDRHICQGYMEHIFLSHMEKKDSGFQITLQAPSSFHKKWIQENLLEDIQSYLLESRKEVCEIRLEVAPSLPAPKNSTFSEPSLVKEQSIFFHKDYVFENFVVGKNNHLAYSASQSVSQQKKAEEGFNPLFIYGPSGLGKTHLLNAVGREFLKKYPGRRILYLSAERFLNEYVSAIRNKQMDSFRKKFRKNCDLLLMDDIQIISKGEGVQEEFFHTFNELYSKKTQIVVCCDENPGAVPRLEERIRTRLEGGLMVDISYPDRETRLAILKNKARIRNLILSEESLELISQTCRHSIREMEGVLNKIKIMTELHEGHLSLKEVGRILKDLKKDLTIEEIQKKTAKVFSISLESLKSVSRKKQIVTARQTAMYMVRKNLKKSLIDISLAFGKKDHTTVLNSLKKVEKLKLKDAEFKKLLEVLQKDIHNNYQGF